MNDEWIFGLVVPPLAFGLGAAIAYLFLRERKP